MPDERYIECRRHCAFNLPAMFIFVSAYPDDVEAILITFDALTSDHYYMVRKTIACGIHEVRLNILKIKYTYFVYIVYK